MFSTLLYKYLRNINLYTLNSLFASNIGKQQWENMCRKAIVGYWTTVYVNVIKTKKTLKYLSVCQLRVGFTHLVWQNIETVAAVRKAIIKARFVYAAIK